MEPQYLGEAAFSASQTVPILCSPDAFTGKQLNYLAGVLLKCTLVLTSAATSDAITVEQYPGAVQLIDMTKVGGGQYFAQPLPGAYFRHVTKLLMERGHDDPTAISANSNTTNTKYFELFIPYFLPKLLGEEAARNFLELSAFLKQINITWPAASLFGTGQTITTGTKVEAYAVHRPSTEMEMSGRLVYGKSPIGASFLGGNCSMQGYHGTLIALGLGDFSAPATNRIGATDFTHASAKGREWEMKRTAIDVPTNVYNQQRGGSSWDGYITPPTEGSGVGLVPLYTPPKGEKLSRLKREGGAGPQIDLTVGAGAPAVTDQEYFWILGVDADPAKVATDLAVSAIPLDTAAAIRAVQHAGPPEGRGGKQATGSRVAGMLRRKLGWRQALGR